VKSETVEKLAALAERTGAKVARELAIFACDAVSIVRDDLPTAADATAPDEDEGMTAEEAAQELGVERWRVYDMIQRGILPAFKPSANTVRLRRGDVREFIRTGKCAPKTMQPQRRPVLHSVPPIPLKEVQKG
jgi:excisionase family DNA binding protein